MEATTQTIGLYTPVPTYFITQRGNLIAGPSGADPYGEPAVLPNFHKRQEDTDNNPLVRVILQNVSSSTAVIVAVLDETNSECIRLNQFSIAGGEPLELITDTKLKLAAVFGYGNASYQAMLFYRRPLNR